MKSNPLARRCTHRVTVFKDSRRTEYAVALNTSLATHARYSGMGSGHIELRETPCDVDLYDESRQPYCLAILTIKNSTGQGDGYLEYHMAAPELVDPRNLVRTDGRPALAMSIESAGHPDRQPADELDRGERSGRICDGGAPVTVRLLLCRDRVNSMSGKQASISATTQLRLTTYPDGNEKNLDDTISIAVNFRVRRYFGRLRLAAVDFGTSAVAVALYRGDGEIAMLDLQEPYMRRSDDRRNSEAGTPYIPSASVIATEPQVPGHREFLELPAETKTVRTNPERVLFALKSLIGTGHSRVVFEQGIDYLDRDKNRITAKSLPVWDCLRSAFSRVTDTHVRPALKRSVGKDRISRVAITHPNTFTLFQQEQLRELASELFPDALEIYLISESDAAAFACLIDKQIAAAGNVPDRETLLVYDMGAGTLDLSLIDVTWDRPTGRPAVLDIRDRLGVPMAGNRLTELVARHVDRRLNELRKLHPEQVTRYRTFVAHKTPGRDELSRLRNSLIDLRESILRFKKTLHRGGKQPIEVSREGDSFFADFQSVDEIPGQPIIQSRSGWYQLMVDSAHLAEDEELSEFLDYVATDVVLDFLGNNKFEFVGGGPDGQSRQVGPGQIDTLIITGRSSMWPGLHQRILANFAGPPPEVPQISRQRLKDAVVMGAAECFGTGRQGTVIRDTNINGHYALSYYDRSINRYRRHYLFADRSQWKSTTRRLGPVERQVYMPHGTGTLELPTSDTIQLVCTPTRDADADYTSWRRGYIANASPMLPLTDLFTSDLPPNQCIVEYQASVSEDSKLSVVLRCPANNRSMRIVASRTASGTTARPWPMGETILEPRSAGK
ncbi:MAG: hypothetical protein MJE77_08915 [Proteobacteria bacterium]|nr:hypothetical protein [Pseudomonadota bacterium]